MVREKTWENSYMLPLGYIWNIVWAYIEYPVGPIFTGMKLIGDHFVPSGEVSTLVNTTDGTVRQKNGKRYHAIVLYIFLDSYFIVLWNVDIHIS